jgi:hypothetical protein
VNVSGQLWKRLEIFFPARKDNHLKDGRRLLLRRGGKTSIMASDYHVTITIVEDRLSSASEEWMDMHEQERKK